MQRLPKAAANIGIVRFASIVRHSLFRQLVLPVIILMVPTITQAVPTITRAARTISPEIPEAPVVTPAVQEVPAAVPEAPTKTPEAPVTAITTTENQIPAFSAPRLIGFPMVPVLLL